MPTSRIAPLLALALLLLAGCAASGSSINADEQPSIDNVEDLVMHLARRGYVLRSTQLAVPFALADVGYEYRVDGERIRIYEFESKQDAERAVEDFILDTSGGQLSTVFQQGSLMVAYAGRSPGLQLTLANTLGSAVY